MHRLPIRLLTLAVAAAWALGATAQTTSATKPVAKRMTKPLPSTRKQAPAPVVDEPLPPSTGEQNAAASMIYFGHYDCEFNQTVEVSMNPKYDGYVDVAYGKHKYTMKPVLSSTGALRLEDVHGETLLLQIAFKSMLMDVKAGHRLVDDCVSEKQLVARRAAEGQPTAGLIGDSATAAPTPR